MATEKSLSVKDLAKKSPKQLVQLRNDLRKDLFEHKLAMSVRKLNQTHLIKLARKNIARVNTALKVKSVA
jgi:ribosomal protein L29